MLYFTTKRDRNGNRYTISVNLESKEFIRDCNNLFWKVGYDECIEVGSRRGLDKVEKQLLENGFSKVINGFKFTVENSK